jgi:hypothetical protein
MQRSGNIVFGLLLSSSRKLLVLALKLIAVLATMDG